MAPIVIVVTVEIEEDRMDEFLKVMEIDAKESRKEEGCLRFDFLKSIDKANTFTFYEAYKDVDAASFHKTTSHYKGWAAFKESGGVRSQTALKNEAIHWQ